MASLVEDVIRQIRKSDSGHLGDHVPHRKGYLTKPGFTWTAVHADGLIQPADRPKDMPELLTPFDLLVALGAYQRQSSSIMRNVYAFLFLPFLLTAVGGWGQDQKLCAVAMQSSRFVQRFADLHLQISDLQAKLARGSKESTLDQQDKCANRAIWAFENWGYRAKDTADFVGHYKAALGR